MVHEFEHLLIVGDLLQFLDELLIGAELDCGLIDVVAVARVVLLEVLEFLHLDGHFKLEVVDFSLELVLFVGDLVALDLERVYLLILDDVQVLLHLQLALQLGEVVGVALLCWEGVLFVLEIRHGLLLQIHRDVVLQLLDVLIPDLQLLL